jgi:YesN/AraC family two-component response regulator
MSDKIKIMYVDDEEMNLILFEKIFSKKHIIVTAESGEQALELLDNYLDTAIVISDMKMPFMSGLEFIQKARIKFSNIKFFILTGYDITDEIREAFNSNLILNYFRKPFNFNEIDSAIQTALV